MSSRPEAVLDASALLAMLHDESGAEQVLAVLEKSVISAVNWAEVYARSAARRVEVIGLRDDLEAVGLRVLSFSPDHADRAGALWSVTREYGLSLGDRACLALALDLGLPALTADRLWTPLDVGAEIRVIR